jgi:hypothetical protein
VRARWLSLLLLLSFSSARAQIGEHRNDLAVGFSGGYMMSSVNFLPRVPQGQLGGLTGGVIVRYTCEKYFKSICSLVGEVNYSQMGWKEDIQNTLDEPVPVLNPETGEEIEGSAEAYQRRINYIQIPVMARLGWGRERKGLQFYFQVGPQISFYLSEEAKYNFDLDHPNLPSFLHVGRRSTVTNHYHMPVENKFDYGIAGGIGLEFSHPKIGHFLVDGRYYYGLGNIYGNTKRDYFAISNFQAISVKLTYLFDVFKVNDPKIK